MAGDSLYSECWRCALGNSHRAAPFIWLGLFVAGLAVALRWGLLATLGIVGIGMVALALMTTGGMRRPATFWLVQIAVGLVSLGFLGFALTRS